MGFHRKFLRKIIPREIREPISKVTEAIEEKILDPVSEVTEKIEDAVRPVTDPVRKFVSKAVPKEIKGILGSSAAIALGAAAGGPLTAFLTSAAYDAYLQKLMTDPDAEDTGVSLESAILSGIGGSLKNVASTLPKTGPGDAIKSQTIEQMVGSEGVKATAPELVKSNTLRELTNLGVEAGQLAEPYLTAPSLDMGLKEGAKQALKFSTGMGTLRSPLVAQDIMQGIEDQEDAMAASEAATKANYDALQEERVASMLGSFERAGFEPEETQREIEEEGLTVSLEEVQDYFDRVRQFVAKGGRIGFQDGSQEGPMTMKMGIGRYIEEETIRRKMLDKIKRMMDAKAFNMQQNLPGPVMRNLNMLNPFDKDPTGQQEIFDMKNRYMDTMDTMREQGINRAKEFNNILEQMPAPKQDFESYVNMIDKNFPARNNTEGRQFANQGGRMTPEGDPISPDVPKGMQMDLRGGGFIPLGTKPRADDVPAMVGKNEFVLNDRAVSGIGKMITGNPDPRAGARALYELQENMEAMV